MKKEVKKEESSITDEDVVDQGKTKTEDTDPLVEDLPQRENWSYLGNDSTALVDVAEVTPEEDDEDELAKSVDEWCNNQEMPTEEVKSTGIELVKKITKKYNVTLSTTGTVLTIIALLIGKVCNRLKGKIAAPGKKWESWAEENLPFLGSRNRSKYMALAERVDCHPYTFLGIDRLDYLCSVTKDWDEKNPVEFLMEKYGIEYDPEDDEESSLKKFKILVDAACHSERLINRKIEVDQELVKSLTSQGCKFDGSLINTIKSIKRAGGDPESHLREMIAHGGKEPSDKDGSGKTRIEDFNSLSNRLITIVEYITDNPDQIAKIDKNSLLQLKDRLSKLIEAANLTSKDEAAA